MRHRKKINHLGRKAEHRKAMLANMAVSLIMNKRIKTTVAKAKVLRVFVEPIITRAKREKNQTKEQYTHNMRMAFRKLRNKYAVKELFTVVAQRVGERPGGYTRILKIGHRVGDAAPMAYIELVDFNTTYRVDKESTTSKKRRRRRGGSKKKSSDQRAATISAEKKDQQTPDEQIQKEQEVKQEQLNIPQAEKKSQEEQKQPPKENKDNA